MPYVAVVGGSSCSERQAALAREVGRLLAERAALILCGGLEGVMEHVSRGASDAGGTVIGLLPGADRRSGNPYLTWAVATGMGEMRNALLARAADSLIAIGGGYGTLSEVALALRLGRTVAALDTWRFAPPGETAGRAGSAAEGWGGRGRLVPCETALEAVEVAVRAARERWGA
ncbi:hypothetical protein LIP_0711 [Limnochorda pilosa]|uniref:TIGR00725 family protein n=1 Tax=Limnochorda pilosa TaxID=1555112 RepID=A0A0K2SHI1_LIMPI|nr:hypothetical protein LIP_0711 [Limnochorda pilosa]